MLIVQLRPAVLTVVLVRTLAFFHNADASTMLPDATAVALDEQATSIFALRVGAAEGFAERRTRVFLVSAYAARYLLLFSSSYVVSIVFLFCILLGGV